MAKHSEKLSEKARLRVMKAHKSEGKSSDMKKMMEKKKMMMKEHMK